MATASLTALPVSGFAALPASTTRKVRSTAVTGVSVRLPPGAVIGRSGTGVPRGGLRRPSGWLSSQLAATVADPPVRSFDGCA